MTIARMRVVLAHGSEVAALASTVARCLGLDEEHRALVTRAAQLHDIGKVAIPDAILDKPGPLRPEEEAVLRGHAVIGERMVGAVPALRPVAGIIRASHERWDGRGYPDGLRGRAIPLGARIVSVCDAFSAMREERPYGDVLSDEEALHELRRCAGTQFDPHLVDVFRVALAVPA